jgi:hypothetical protein
MFQIQRAEILKDAQGAQTGVKVTFESGQEIAIDFDEIPASITSASAKAQWLKEQLMERLIVGHKLDGTPIRHYKVNVVAVSEDPFAIAWSWEAV